MTEPLHHPVRRMFRLSIPRPPRTVPTALLLAALATVLLTVLVAGCQPREIVPRTVSRLLPPEREAVAYRRLVLPNGLKVMLVSNPNASRSGAALAVAVGSLSDPVERPGMAHFLEHMLFLGTKKYPEAGGYSRFMSSNAGFSNAYTADDHTNYFFGVSHEGFEEGLDRFAQFFIAPLLNDELAGREMNAVDSEHAKNVESDYWRIRQVQRNHYRASHPINRFSTGNLETLRGVGNTELIAFYQRHYAASRMTLAVVGQLELDRLEGLVRGRFDRIADRPGERPRFSPDYLEPKRVLRLLRIEPVADLRQLTLHFSLPPVERYYASKPLSLIASILGHEGQGSLLSLLKADGLALSLSAGGAESTADYSSLEITVALTPKGLERHREVIGKVLGTIEGLRRTGIPRNIFDERQAMAELTVRFRSPPPSPRLATRLAAMMHRFPLEALPDEPLRLTEYRPELVRALLKRLTPDNLLVTLVAKGLPTERREAHYGARYGYAELEGQPFQSLEAAVPDARWRLPTRNRFIPDRVAMIEPEGPLKLAGVSLHHLRGDGAPEALMARLRPLKGETFTGAGALMARLGEVLPSAQRKKWLPGLLKNSLPLPVRLLDTPRAKVWYLPDWRLRQPRAELVLRFHVEGAYGSAREAMLGKLYEAVIEEELNELGYPIKEAGLHYNIAAVKYGLTLTVGGYSARMLDLLQVLVNRLQRVSIAPETFAALHETLVRSLENARLEQPYHRSRYFTRMLLETPNFTVDAQLEALRGLTLRDVRAYARRFLRRTYLEGVVVGNLPRGEARAGLRRALDVLGAGVLPPEKRVGKTILALPAGADWMFTERLPIANSLITLIYQAGKTDPALRGALLVIGKPLRQQFYHLMRTRQQLGYIVFAGMGQMRKTLSLFFLVQSGQYPADELLRRMEGFIPGFIAAFKALPESDFERFRSAVIQAKLEREKTLGEIAENLFWRAFENEGKFDHVSEDIAAVEALTRAEVEAVLSRVLVSEGRKRLAIRLIGRGHAAGPPKGEVVRLPPAVRAKAG